MAITLKNTNFAVGTLAYEVEKRFNPAQLILTENNGFITEGLCRAVIWDGSKASPLDDPNREIVELEAYGFPGFEDTFNCYGGKEGTQKRDWPAGSKIAHVVTAGKLDEIEAEINLKSHQHSNKAVLDLFSGSASNLNFGSSVVETRGSVSVKDSSYAMTGNERAVFVNAGGLDVTITLPQPALNTGKIFIVKRIDSGVKEVRISRNSTELIDTQSADILLNSQGSKAILISTGTDWFTV
jgi:hypothetical protein